MIDRYPTLTDAIEKAKKDPESMRQVTKT